MNQTELASKLGIRKSAVNQVFRGDGNVPMNTLAEYLHELGFEAHVELAPAGTARLNVRDYAPKPHLEWIAVGKPTFQESTSAAAPKMLSRESFTAAA